jgi:hypothetical protein
MLWHDDLAFHEDRLLPIVVGAHPRAELVDRPLAYRLLDRIEDWQITYCDDRLFQPIVLTDVWVLNHEGLLERPAIAIGNPRYNAACAFLTSRVPVMESEEDEYLVQIETGPPFVRACLWGSNSGNTTRAVDRFLDDHIDDWMHHATACDTASA